MEAGELLKTLGTGLDVPGDWCAFHILRVASALISILAAQHSRR